MADSDRPVIAVVEVYPAGGPPDRTYTDTQIAQLQVAIEQAIETAVFNLLAGVAPARNDFQKLSDAIDTKIGKDGSGFQEGLKVFINGLPKTSVGLQVGDYWNDGGILVRVESMT